MGSTFFYIFLKSQFWSGSTLAHEELTSVTQVSESDSLSRGNPPLGPVH